MEDEAIIRLLFDREEEGVQALDAKYGGLCRQLAYRILGNWQDAEECVNDAYLGAWNAIPPERPQVLSAYLCRIVRNQAVKICERRGAQKRASAYTVAMEELAPFLAGPDTAETALETRELGLLIEGFLDTLAGEDRVIFLRRYWFADSYREIAGRVGRTEKGVSVRLSRIRKRLKHYLEERGEFAC